MGLRDEIPSKQPQVLFFPIDQSAHDELEQLTADFIARGGKVSQVPIGASAIKSTLAQQKPRPSVTPTRTFGQNIIERTKRGKVYYIVKVMNQYFGTNENWSPEEARKNRDRIRKNCGLPPAVY